MVYSHPAGFLGGSPLVRLTAAKLWIMIALGHIPHKPNIKAVSHICLAAIVCWLLQAGPTNGQELSSETSTYLEPLEEQQKELGRIDDALKGGIQQIERACKPFIEEDSLEKVELKPNTYLQLNQARASIETKSNNVLLQFKNVQNVAGIKEVELCHSATSAQSTDSCLSLKYAIEKLESLESYFLKTTSRNIQIFDNFVVVGKLEALQCVRPDFTDNLIQSYLRRVDETDISGLKYYRSKLSQLKTEIQSHE